MGLFLGDKQIEIKSIILALVDLKQIMKERVQMVVVMWGGTRGILFYSVNGEEILVTPSHHILSLDKKSPNCVALVCADLLMTFISEANSPQIWRFYLAPRGQFSGVEKF